ncbi:McrC family protein [Isoptericola sp. NEAU-Y5]|uniref:McrC family protein n=1 Tax=Isoptericola luteus TaxID=2879484 RepID=A0ABS7ZH08_9MICO|nr:McrC family protein [Isoptericola sp. NEAU-Y5]MCA5894310.1 McrC family protein [Isoptericola sp. NEAU-Y5]
MALEPAESVGHGRDGQVWDLGQPVLEMREQSEVRATAELVAAVSPATWERLGLVVRRSPGDTYWIVRSSDLAGVVRLDVRSTHVHLRIQPKLVDLDLFFLADWAFGSQKSGRAFSDARAELQALRAEPAACLLGWYIAEMVAFATRWTRRGYVVRHEDLVGRVRGHIDVARYAAMSLAQARPHVIPARFTEPSHDTPPNQYLKAGIRHAAALSRAVPLPAAQRALQELSRRGLSLLAGVSDVRLTARDGQRLNLAGPLRHYRQPVAFTTAVLDGTFLSTELGTHSQEAIMWSLNVLYEESLRRVLEAWPGATSVRTPLRATVEGSLGERLGASAVKPDYVFRRGDGTLLVLDAKYKDVTPRSALGAGSADDVVDVAPTKRQRVRVRRADVYQAVAYGRHEGLGGSTVGLLYPVTLAHDEPYPAPLRLREFDPRVHVVFFDVGPTASSHVTDLYAVLDGLGVSAAQPVVTAGTPI